MVVVHLILSNSADNDRNENKSVGEKKIEENHYTRIRFESLGGAFFCLLVTLLIWVDAFSITDCLECIWSKDCIHY